jgi:hypothetical protein
VANLGNPLAHQVAIESIRIGDDLSPARRLGLTPMGGRQGRLLVRLLPLGPSRLAKWWKSALND